MASRTERKIWFALVAPITAWAVQGLAGVIIDHIACAEGVASVGRGLMIAISVIALCFAIASVLIGHRQFRALSEEPALGRAQATGRQEMMAFAGLMLGVVFTIGIVWATLSSLFVSNLCGAER